MMQEMRYSEHLLMSEFRIAAMDELKIEGFFFGHQDGFDASDKQAVRRDLESAKIALRRIDELKISGDYESVRAELAEHIAPIKESWAAMIKRIDYGEFEPFHNFTRGMQSPDPEQRARFQKLYYQGEFAEKAPREVWHILTCLEPAKRRKGRRTLVTPWANVVEHMEAMRLDIARGATVVEAAAARAAMDRVSGDAERAKTLAKLYRQKMALRE
jgi:hypothetical protein